MIRAVVLAAAAAVTGAAALAGLTAWAVVQEADHQRRNR